MGGSHLKGMSAFQIQQIIAMVSEIGVKKSLPVTARVSWPWPFFERPGVMISWKGV